MSKLYIICVEDQREVLDAIANDLADLEDKFIIEECESAGEAWALLEEIDNAGDQVALLISDHVMPGQSGVDFLIEVNRDERFRHTKKLLLTGLATHQDTIKAINSADLDRYLEKPWTRERLLGYARILLTEYILETGIDYLPYLPQLDQATLFNKLRNIT